MKWNRDLYWTDLGYDRGKGWAVLNTLMYFVIKSGIF